MLCENQPTMSAKNSIIDHRDINGVREYRLVSGSNPSVETWITNDDNENKKASIVTYEVGLALQQTQLGEPQMAKQITVTRHRNNAETGLLEYLLAAGPFLNQEVWVKFDKCNTRLYCIFKYKQSNQDTAELSKGTKRTLKASMSGLKVKISKVNDEDLNKVKQKKLKKILDRSYHQEENIFYYQIERDGDVKKDREWVSRNKFPEGYNEMLEEFDVIQDLKDLPDAIEESLNHINYESSSNENKSSNVVCEVEQILDRIEILNRTKKGPRSKKFSMTKTYHYYLHWLNFPKYQRSWLEKDFIDPGDMLDQFDRKCDFEEKAAEIKELLVYRERYREIWELGKFVFLFFCCPLKTVILKKTGT